MPWLFILFVLVFLPTSKTLHSQLIEFYADWAWKAKGTKLFTPRPELPEAEWSVLCKIQSRLKEKGWEIQSWDYDFYQPLLKKGSRDEWNLWKKSGKVRLDTIWVFWNMGGMLKGFDLSRMPKERMVLFMWEPPTVQPSLYKREVQNLFGKIFTWDDDLVDNQKFFKFNYTCLKKRIETVPDFEKKKFCTMINSSLKSKYHKELYSEREKVVRFFEDKEGEFDLYGRRWEGYKNWKGTTKDKLTTLSQYKFCICYENTKDIKGYITEKIFDCFAAGCVPIYWGASNITDYIPAECFIDRRDFSNTEEVYAYLKKMGRREYEQYLDHAATFLKSDQAQIFSRDTFVDLFMNELVQR